MDGDGHATRREEATDAMVAAAERLFAERGFEAVSVRDIAQEAGVSHALVHRYLGSKDAIRGVILARHQMGIRDAAAGETDLADAMTLMVREGLAHHQDYLRLLMQSSLEGVPLEATLGRLPAAEQLAAMADEVAATRPGGAPGDVTPRFAVAALVALYLGWIASEDWLVQAMGLEGVDEESLVAQLEVVLRGIIARNIMGERD